MGVADVEGTAISGASGSTTTLASADIAAQKGSAVAEGDIVYVEFITDAGKKYRSGWVDFEDAKAACIVETTATPAYTTNYITNLDIPEFRAMYNATEAPAATLSDDGVLTITGAGVAGTFQVKDQFGENYATAYAYFTTGLDHSVNTDGVQLSTTGGQVTEHGAYTIKVFSAEKEIGASDALDDLLASISFYYP